MSTEIATPEQLAIDFVWDKITRSGQDAKTWALLHRDESGDDINEFLEWLGYSEPLPMSDYLTIVEMADQIDPDGTMDEDELTAAVHKRIAKQTDSNDLEDRVLESTKHRDVFATELKASYQMYAAFFGYTNPAAANVWSGMAVTAYLMALKEAEIKGKGADDAYILQQYATDDANFNLHKRAITEAWENTTAALEFEEPDYPHANLAEALAAEQEPEKYRVADILTEGSTCAIVAKAKAGKTTLVMNLMKSLADGSPFLGKEVTPVERNVCYWDLELVYTYQLDRFRQVGIENAEKIINRPLQGYTTALSTAIGQNFAVKDLTEAQADVWIIDTFGAAFDGEDENHNSQVRKFFKGVDRVKRLSGVKEVFIIFHTGKGDSHSARGASASEDWPAVIWEYGGISGKAIDPDDARRKMFVYGRLAPQTLYVEYDSGVLSLIDEPAKGKRASDKPQQIVDFLRDNPDSSQSDITLGIGLSKDSRSAVRPHLEQLVRIDHILCEENGSGKTKTYRINPVFDPSKVMSVNV